MPEDIRAGNTLLKTNPQRWNTALFLRVISLFFDGFYCCTCHIIFIHLIIRVWIYLHFFFCFIKNCVAWTFCYERTVRGSYRSHVFDLFIYTFFQKTNFIYFYFLMWFSTILSVLLFSFRELLKLWSIWFLKKWIF